MKAKEKAKIVMYTIATLITIWFVLSYIDVISHNMTTHEYSKLNMIVIMLEMAN